MRMFIGIKLSDCYNQIIDIQNKFKKSGFIGNYTLPNNIHLTLLFLGELNFKEFDNVKSALNKIKYPNFNIYLDKVKNFKDMLIVELRKNKELMLLHSIIKEELTKENIYIDRRLYYPHITLVRKTDNKYDEQIFLVHNVKEIILFSSERINKRLTYIPKYILKLRGNDA